MLDRHTIDIVKATAPVLVDHAEAITRRFYELMFAGNPETRPFFNPAHQHAGTQQRALAGAICAYAANIDNLPALGTAVELIAHKHASLGIQREHYPIVGKHLLVAIKDVLGEAATDDIIAAWGTAYGVLAQVFVDREARLYQQHAAVPGGWTGYRRFRVQRKVSEAELITSLYFVPEDGGPLATFLPGQYITVNVSPPGVENAPRNYSLSDRPGLEHYRISVKREPGPAPGDPAGVVSNYLHEQVNVGSTLQIGPPCGNFTLDPAGCGQRPIVLLSGGIGLTPVLAMFKALAHHGTTAPVHFIHAARNSRMHAMADEVRRVAAQRGNFRVHFRYDAPLPGDLSAGRCDSVGLIDLTLIRDLLRGPDAEFYFCGPKPFMVGLYKDLKAWGVDDARLHFEFFGPRQELTAG